MHICFVLTTPFALNAFVAPAIRALLALGWKVTVVVNARAGSVAEDIRGEVEVIDLDIVRSIAPLRDLWTVSFLIRLFRKSDFDIIHSVTPKAGLLAMMAARVTRIPVRIHTFTGQVWATRRGLMRWLLRSLDRLLAACATTLLVDSASQRQFLVKEAIAALDRLHVLGNGSIAGVDTARFTPQPQWRDEIRKALGVPSDAMVLIYIGRMQAEKGINELVRAFSQLSCRSDAVHLFLVGPDEGALGPALNLVGAGLERIHVIGLTPEPQKYMAAADIFCLASYREGFGLSLIEAASAGLPCVASRIYGVTDAVVDGVTGLLVPVRDVGAIVDASTQLMADAGLRQKLGAAARARAQQQFSQAVVVDAWLAFYRQQLLQTRAKF